jgi:hypothetical protein
MYASLNPSKAGNITMVDATSNSLHKKKEKKKNEKK